MGDCSIVGLEISTFRKAHATQMGVFKTAKYGFNTIFYLSLSTHTLNFPYNEDIIN